MTAMARPYEIIIIRRSCGLPHGGETTVEFPVTEESFFDPPFAEFVKREFEVLFRNAGCTEKAIAAAMQRQAMMWVRETGSGRMLYSDWTFLHGTFEERRALNQRDCAVSHPGSEAASPE